MAAPDPHAQSAGDAIERLTAFANGGPMRWRQIGGATDFNALRADILAALAAAQSAAA